MVTDLQHSQSGAPARRICHACKLRKKACDKGLPACGFCVSRKLVCRYDALTPNSKGRWTHSTSGHFVPLRSSLSPRLSPLSERQQGNPATYHSSLYVSPQPVEELLNRHLQHFSELYNFTYDDIINHYPQAFHKWMPVISLRCLRQEASRYREEGRVPPADFTLLLLTMMLIIVPALDTSLPLSHATQELLYTTTRSAFSQAQASICTSVRLVQAALLIALHDYMRVRPEAAYVSLMTCVGMARILGIELSSVTEMTGMQEPSHSQYAGVEKINLALGIALLERLVLCEMNRSILKLQTDCQGLDCWLAADVSPTEEHDSWPRLTSPTVNQFTASSQYAAEIGHFERQTRLISLLDRLLFLMRLTASTPETKLAELAELDGKLRTFLEPLMVGLALEHLPVCGYVALCIRLLLLLHASVLDILQHIEGRTAKEKRDMSWLALDTVCRMTLDAIESDSAQNPLMMPICRYYTCRAARERLQERNKLATDEALSRDIESMLHAEEEYRKTWVF